MKKKFKNLADKKEVDINLVDVFSSMEEEDRRLLLEQVYNDHDDSGSRRNDFLICQGVKCGFWLIKLMAASAITILLYHIYITTISGGSGVLAIEEVSPVLKIILE